MERLRVDLRNPDDGSNWPPDRLCGRPVRIVERHDVTCATLPSMPKQLPAPCAAAGQYASWTGSAWACLHLLPLLLHLSRRSRPTVVARACKLVTSRSSGAKSLYPTPLMDIFIEPRRYLEIGRRLAAAGDLPAHGIDVGRHCSILG